MRLSAFNLYVEDYPLPGATLVHNTFSGAFAELDSTVLALLRKADTGAPLDPADAALIDPDLRHEDVGIVVESRQEEEQAYRAWFERQRSATRELAAMVSVTFACNLDCTYCCQADVLDGTTMKTSVAVETGRWLAERAIEIGAERISLMFVGGEPLLQPERIETVLDEIRARTAERGIALDFGLITNGVLLTRDLVERWIPLGLKRAKVTLDGDETTHAITRRSKKGRDSFDVIFRNVIDSCRLIDININGNYQEDTARGFVPLAKKLAAAGFPAGGRVRFSPALAALGAPTDAAYGTCTIGGSHPELMLAFSDEIRRAGFDPGDPLKLGPCSFHQRHYYAVDPSGAIYKCPGFLGHPEWAIGHVATGLTGRYDALVQSNPQRECGTCAHRPDCAGGCVAAAWTAAGRIEGVNCEIGYFDSQQTSLVTRKYLLATNDTPEAAIAAFPRLSTEIPAPKETPRPGIRPKGLTVLAA